MPSRYSRTPAAALDPSLSEAWTGACAALEAAGRTEEARDPCARAEKTKQRLLTAEKGKLRGVEKFAARADRALPKGYSDALLQVHDKRPWSATPAEIAELARELRDANFRIEVATDGVHIFAKHFHALASDAMSLYPRLGVEHDGGHAFYLGVELMKAELAFKLGKRYRQDEPLDFGVAMDKVEEDATRFREMSHTLRKSKEGRADDAADS